MKTVSREDQIQEILRKPYHRVVVPDGPEAFLARIAEFEGCIALAKTATGALEQLEQVAASWLESLLARELPIPEPHEEPVYSGKLMLRLPRSLHQKAAETAEREGVSLNQLIVASLAEQIGARKPQQRAVIDTTIRTYSAVPLKDLVLSPRAYRVSIDTYQAVTAAVTAKDTITVTNESMRLMKRTASGLTN